MTDNVNNPPHYNKGNLECIEAIYEALGHDGFKSYCQGNALKYLWRHKYKANPVEDLKKAQWYINKLIQAEEYES